MIVVRDGTVEISAHFKGQIEVKEKVGDLSRTLTISHPNESEIESLKDEISHLQTLANSAEVWNQEAGELLDVPEGTRDMIGIQDAVKALQTRVEKQQEYIVGLESDSDVFSEENSKLNATILKLKAEREAPTLADQVLRSGAGISNTGGGFINLVGIDGELYDLWGQNETELGEAAPKELVTLAEATCTESK